jgi:hypothetical protein
MTFCVRDAALVGAPPRSCDRIRTTEGKEFILDPGFAELLLRFHLE